HLKYKDPEQG
nr:RecName: Full=44 kDa cell wall protein [Arabidopsis thaliana]